MSKEETKPLNKKQQRFIDEYFLCNMNGTEAYSRVYNPKGGRDVARANASELLAKPNVNKIIQERMSAYHMTADEALKLQADIARGDITELLTPLGHVDIDLIRKNGKGRLIKKIKQRTITKIGKSDKDEDTEIHETEIELYPADTAQERILKVQGKMKGDGTTINVNMSWKDFVEGKTKESEV